MSCCDIIYPGKTEAPCSLCGDSFCVRCLRDHFRKEREKLVHHKLAMRLMKQGAFNA